MMTLFSHKKYGNHQLSTEENIDSERSLFLQPHYLFIHNLFCSCPFLQIVCNRICYIYANSYSLFKQRSCFMHLLSVSTYRIMGGIVHAKAATLKLAYIAFRRSHRDGGLCTPGNKRCYYRSSA